MKKGRKEMKTKVPRWIYWTPRILSILFLCFLALFSLDVFDEHLGLWGTIVGLLMHNIPVFILLIVLLVSWRYEWVGGAAFILAGLLYIASALNRVSLPMALIWSLTISGPAFFIGILFLINWFKKKQK